MKTVILDLNGTPYENGKKAGEHFHQLVDYLKEDIKKLEKVILKYLLNDNDEENIIKYNDLFKN